jgi:hypothetical protein
MIRACRILSFAACVASAGIGVPLAAQAPSVQVSSGVEPAAVTVGDPFRSVIRVDAPPGMVVEFPEQLGITEAYQSLGPVEMLPGDEGDPHIAVYPMVAWQTGELTAPVVPVYLRSPDGTEHVLRVTLPLPEVRSVLPADTAGIEPRGARGVLADETRFSFWWLLAIALLLLLSLIGMAAWWWRRRRRGVPTAAAEPASARERALAELEQVRALGLVEAGEWKPFYSGLSGALRRYLASLSPRWGADLTTEEIVASVSDEGMPFEVQLRLESVLRQADRVKFARARATREEAERDWFEARALVQELEPGVREAVAVGGAEA